MRHTERNAHVSHPLRLVDYASFDANAFSFDARLNASRTAYVVSLDFAPIAYAVPPFNVSVSVLDDTNALKNDDTLAHALSVLACHHAHHHIATSAPLTLPKTFTYDHALYYNNADHMHTFTLTLTTTHYLNAPNVPRIAYNVSHTPKCDCCDHLDFHDMSLTLCDLLDYCFVFENDYSYDDLDDDAETLFLTDAINTLATKHDKTPLDVLNTLLIDASFDMILNHIDT